MTSMTPKRYEILSTDDPHPTRRSRWGVWATSKELESIAEARAEIDRIKAKGRLLADLTYWVRKVGNKYPVPLL